MLEYIIALKLYKIDNTYLVYNSGNKSNKPGSIL